ncbi:MAG TPA: YjiG family protein [Symbiobacteriaceae bacterium]
MAEHAQPVRKTILDLFVEGARQGWKIATTQTMPNVVMAFVIIQALKITGLMDLIGMVFRPIMGLWGLPGEAATVLLAAFMSMGGGVGVAAGLYTSGILDAADITVIIPAIFLMGSLVQYMGRCLGTADVNARYWGVIIGIAILNALLAMWVMRLILLFV